jgi:hypothetical protein
MDCWKRGTREASFTAFRGWNGLFASHPSAAQATQAAVNFGQDDDITVLTLTRLATGEESLALNLA